MKSVNPNRGDGRALHEIGRVRRHILEVDVPVPVMRAAMLALAREIRRRGKHSPKGQAVADRVAARYERAARGPEPDLVEGMTSVDAHHELYGLLVWWPQGFWDGWGPPHRIIQKAMKPLLAHQGKEAEEHNERVTMVKGIAATVAGGLILAMLLKGRK